VSVSRKLVLVGVLGCVASSAAHAQQASTAPSSALGAAPAAQAPAPRSAQRATTAPTSAAKKPLTPEDLDTEVDAITITASGKPFGAVLGDVPPEVTFSAADVRSYGVSSITDLLTELAPQTTSASGGDPVTLLNGRRISGQGEIRDIPTEAIQRVEVLPEEVALKYGYTADQKVVNIVLRQRFRAHTFDGTVGGSTAGGQMSEQGNYSQLRLNRQGRTNFGIRIQNTDALLESDRDLVSRANSGFYDFIGNVTAPTTERDRPGVQRPGRLAHHRGRRPRLSGERRGPAWRPSCRRPARPISAISATPARCSPRTGRSRSTASPTAISGTMSRRR
jgi:iron complex outermembrane receptor protein